MRILVGLTILVLGALASETTPIRTPRVEFFSEAGVTTKQGAKQACAGKNLCIAHDSQLIADHVDGNHHSQCGITWDSNDDKPVRVICADAAGKHDTDEDETECSRVKTDPGVCSGQDFGYFCRVKNEGDDEVECHENDISTNELYIKRGGYHKLAEARAACENDGSKLVYYHQAIDAVVKSKFSTNSFCIVEGVAVFVFQFNRGHKGTVEFHMLDQQLAQGYCALCKGTTPHHYMDPCKMENPNVAGKEVECYEPANGSEDKYILVQQRPRSAQEEDNVFMEKAENFKAWQEGFKVVGDDGTTKGYYIGHDHLAPMTEQHDCELMIELWRDDMDNDHYIWARYEDFRIEGKEHTSDVTSKEKCKSYTFRAESYDEASTAQDAFKGDGSSSGAAFSTTQLDCDSMNDVHCGEVTKSAWWHGAECSRSNLNGLSEGQPFYNEQYGNCKLWRPIDKPTPTTDDPEQWNQYAKETCFHRTRMGVKCHEAR